MRVQGRSVLIRLVAGVVAANFLCAVPARALDVDFDVALIVLDSFLVQNGISTVLRGADNDSNGLNEDDQLGMLSTILAGGSPVSCIASARKTEILNGYNSNLPKVKTELTVNVSGAGTVDIITTLSQGSNPQLGSALQSVICGYLTVADTATITYVNNLVDSVAAAYLTSLGQQNQISSVQSQINFLAADYQTYGNAPPGNNYLGPAGDIENDGQSNLAEYTTGAVRKDRETWLEDCCITPPMRITAASGGGLRVTGTSETLSAAVTGAIATPAFTWRKGSTASSTVVGTGATFTIPFLTTSHTGNYFCVITDGTTTRTTQIMPLNVTFVALFFVTQPQSVTKSAGRSQTFSCLAQGGVGPGPYQYTWRKGNTVVGTNSATYTIPSVTGADAGTYTVRVTSNGGGDTITSQGAVLTVNTGPFTILTQPQSAKLYVGQPFNLTVVASGGSGNFQYIWTKNGNAFQTTTTGTISTPSVQKSDAATYRCTVKDLNSSATVQTDNAIIQVADALQITQQPQGTSVNVGQVFSMSVAAAGGFTPYKYQWQWEGINIPGQTAAIYSTTAYSGFGGEFTCVVSDDGSQSATSAPANLAVNAIVEITQDPQGGDFYVGESASLTVLATGSGLTYDWRRDEVSVGAPNLPTLNLGTLALNEAGAYTVSVSGLGLAPAISVPAVVRVVKAPTITTQPESVSLYTGSEHILSIAGADGYPPLLFQWRKEGENINNALNATFTLSSIEAGDAGNYSCLVTDQRGTVLTSNTAVITVTDPLQVTSSPTDVFAYNGGTINLSVSTSGGVPPLNYKWLRNGFAFGAAKAAAITITNAQAGSAGSYACEITDATSTKVTSNAAIVQVHPDISISENPQSQSVFLGNTLTLQVGITGGFDPYQYAWRKGISTLDNTNSATFTIPHIAAGDAGNYSCVVSDRFGHVVSSAPAAVSIAEGIDVEIDPPSAKKYTGTNFTITVAVNSGSGGNHFQWFKDAQVLPSAPDQATLDFPALTPADTGSYTCLVTNIDGAGTQTTASVLTVRDTLQIITQPQPDTAAVNGPAALSIEVTGGFEPLAYVWRRGANPVAGQNTAAFQLPATAQADGGSYTCAVTDNIGTSLTSDAATLAVVPALAITSDAADSAAYRGQSGGIDFETSGGVVPITYTWRKGETVVQEGETASLAFDNLTDDDAGVYQCTAVDADGNTVTSAEAALALGDAISIVTQPQAYDRYVGESVTFSVIVEGGIGELHFAWSRGGIAVGPDTSALTISNLDISDSGLYLCEISDDIGSATTNMGGNLYVALPLSAEPAGETFLTIPAGIQHNIAVNVSDGFPPYTFEWTRNDLPLATVTNPLTLSPATVEDSGTYSVTVYDKYTNVIVGQVVTLTVDPAPLLLSADTDGDYVVSLSELLRVIQLYTVGEFHCEPGTEDGFGPGPGATDCVPHTSDYIEQNWIISLSELLRIIQFYGSGAYYACPGEDSEDGFCAGVAPTPEGSAS